MAYILANSTQTIRVMGDPLRMVFDPVAGVGGGGDPENLTTEGGDVLTTEDGDALTTEG